MTRRMAPAGPGKAIGPPGERRGGEAWQAGKRDRREAFVEATAFGSLVGAWEWVSARDPAAGVDRVRPREFRERSVSEIERIHADLRAGSFRSLPLLAFQGPDGKGKIREFQIPSVRDRVVQTALLRVLERLVAPRLSPGCHGYVRGRSTATALAHASAIIQSGARSFLKTDIQSCFPSVDRTALRTRIGALAGEEAAALALEFLGAAIVRRGCRCPAAPAGIPLGQPLSPIALNILLLDTDAALDGAGVPFVRYADDLVIFGRTQAEVDEGVKRLCAELGRAGLELNPLKTEQGLVEGEPPHYLGSCPRVRTFR